jgi:hypothetical protein
VNNQASKSQSALIVFFPAFVHLGVCLAIWLNRLDDTAWQKMFVGDFPFSIIEVGLMFRGVDPLIGIGLLGTLWWLFVGLLIRWLIRAYKKRQA